MKNKKTPKGFNQYNAPSHKNGGQLINNLGIPDLNNPAAEIEGTENSFIFKNLPDEPYVYSDKNLTSGLAKSIIKKYSKKNTDQDESVRNALEIEMKVAKGINEYIKQAKDAADSIQMKFGGSIDPLTSPISPVTSMTAITPTITGTPLSELETDTGMDYKQLAVDNAGSALRTIGMLGNVSQLFQKPEVDTPILPDYRASDAQMAKLDTNLNQARQDSIAASRVASNLNRNSVSNYSSFNAREMQNIGNLQDNLANITQQEVQLKNNIVQTRANYEANKTTTNAQLERQSREINDRNEASQRNLNRVIFGDLVAEGDRLDTIKNNKELAAQQIENNKNLAEASIQEQMQVLEMIYPDVTIDTELIQALQQLSRGEITKDKFEQIRKNKEAINYND